MTLLAGAFLLLSVQAFSADDVPSAGQAVEVGAVSYSFNAQETVQGGEAREKMQLAARNLFLTNFYATEGKNLAGVLKDPSQLQKLHAQVEARSDALWNKQNFMVKRNFTQAQERTLGFLERNQDRMASQDIEVKLGVYKVPDGEGDFTDRPAVETRMKMKDAQGQTREISILRYRGLTGLGLPKSVAAVSGKDGKLEPLTEEDGSIAVFSANDQSFKDFETKLNERLDPKRAAASAQPGASGQPGQ